MVRGMAFPVPEPVVVGIVAHKVVRGRRVPGMSVKMAPGMHVNQTARLVAEALSLEAEKWQVAFQSRFGPEPWLQPYTDETLRRWGRAGVNSVAVIAPGFAVDCLETIDELGREAKEVFLDAGGNDFRYIPSLNDSDLQVNLIKTLVLETL